jgi:hypothetical protein
MKPSGDGSREESDQAQTELDEIGIVDTSCSTRTIEQLLTAIT